MTGTVTTEGVVVGDYEGAEPPRRAGSSSRTPRRVTATCHLGRHLRLQGQQCQHREPRRRRAGHRHARARTRARPRSASARLCTAARAPSPDRRDLPGRDDDTFLERYEGMLVTPADRDVTEHFQLGRFGQVTLSSGREARAADQRRCARRRGARAPGRQQPDGSSSTTRRRPRTPTRSCSAATGSPSRRATPSAAETPRPGSSACSTTRGVATRRARTPTGSGPATRSAVPSTSRPANERPTGPTEVGRRPQVAAMNLLNYFNTFTAAALHRCRRRRHRLPRRRRRRRVRAPVAQDGRRGLGPRRRGGRVNEIENDGYGSDSASRSWSSGSTRRTAPDVRLRRRRHRTGQVNALGTDAIKVGMIYQPARSRRSA